MNKTKYTHLIVEIYHFIIQLSWCLFLYNGFFMKVFKIK